jgi:hypothetical protein
VNGDVKMSVFSNHKPWILQAGKKVYLYDRKRKPAGLTGSEKGRKYGVIFKI